MSEFGRGELEKLLTAAFALSPADVGGTALARDIAADMAQRFHGNEMQTREGRATCANFLRRMADDFDRLSPDHRTRLVGLAERIRRGEVDL